MNTSRMIFWLMSAVLVPTLLSAQSDQDMPYATVHEAMAHLTAMPGVKISKQDGWTVISPGADEDMQTIWTFVPPEHYAYPAVARRETVLDDRIWSVNTSLLCGNTVPACEQLRRDFDLLDMQIRAALQETVSDADQSRPGADN